ncbi:hypothetical protein ACFLS1_09590, partial [Verrucomicrobiota bacterium]
PTFEADFTKLCRTNGFFRLNGKLWIEDCAFNGVDILRGDGRIHASFSKTNSAVTIDRLFVFRREGHAKGELTSDFMRSLISFKGESTMDPKALARIIGVFEDELIDKFEINGSCKIAAEGTVGCNNMDLTDFKASVESRGLELAGFVTDRCVFDMHMTGITNTLSDIQGSIYDGDFSGSARFMLPCGDRTNVSYIAEGVLQEAKLQKLIAARLEEPDKDLQGRLFARVKVGGLIGEGQGHTATGEGEIKIKDGHVFRFPLLGGFTAIITKIIPGLDFVLSQSDAKAEVDISDGQIYSKEILIEGDVLSLNGRGHYDLNGNLSFRVQARLMKEHTLVGKLLQALTYPISSLLEFRLRGTLDNPEWYPINFSKELLRKLGLKNKEDVM